MENEKIVINEIEDNNAVFLSTIVYKKTAEDADTIQGEIVNYFAVKNNNPLPKNAMQETVMGATIDHWMHANGVELMHAPDAPARGLSFGAGEDLCAYNFTATKKALYKLAAEKGIVFVAVKNGRSALQEMAKKEMQKKNKD